MHAPDLTTGPPGGRGHTSLRCVADGGGDSDGGGGGGGGGGGASVVCRADALARDADTFYTHGALSRQVVDQLRTMRKQAIVYVVLHNHSDRRTEKNTASVHVTREPRWRCGSTPHGGHNLFAMAMKCQYADKREPMDVHVRGELSAALLAEPNARARALTLTEYALRSGCTLMYDRLNVLRDCTSGTYLYCLRAALAIGGGGGDGRVISPLTMHHFTVAASGDTTPLGEVVRALLRHAVNGASVPPLSALPALSASSRSLIAHAADHRLRRCAGESVYATADEQSGRRNAGASAHPRAPDRETVLHAAGAATRTMEQCSARRCVVLPHARRNGPGGSGGGGDDLLQGVRHDTSDGGAHDGVPRVGSVVLPPEGRV